MKCKRRSPARFTVTDKSAVFRQTVTWRITITEGGMEAIRDVDHKVVSIGWRTLLSAAIFYGTEKL